MPVSQVKPLLKSAAASLRTVSYGLVHCREASRYCIVPGYRHRSVVSYFDDTANADEWQREVYAYARNLMTQKNLRTVYDVGCGGAFKLVHYLGEFQTVGFDVPPTIAHLRRTYPARKWEVSEFSGSAHHPVPDLVICSDVIEHVSNPDELIGFIKGLRPKFLILSTPDRNLVYHPRSEELFGPPANTTHLREWSFGEFRRYVAMHFTVLEHFISNRDQATQMVFCAPKG